MNAVVKENIKYLANGQIVRVLAEAAPNHIVVEVGRTYEDEDEVFFEGTRVVSKVYDQAPTEAIDARIRALLDREKTLLDIIAALHIEHVTAMRDADARLKYLKQFEPLAFIEDFIQGRITHFVICDYSKVMIKAREEALSTKDDYDRWSKELKLLTLFGRANGCLQWRLNRYSDGSGGNTDVFPCTSLESAQAKAAEVVAGRFEDLRGKEGYPHGINYVMDTANALGIPIPPDIQECWDLHKAKYKEERIKKLEAELASVRSES
jgi:hypothetical protein